jgi:hypothetical protein
MRGGTMRYIRYLGIFLVVLLVSVSLAPWSAYATPPRYIKIQYKADTQTLQVTVSHATPVRKIHYIYRIAVEKNGVLEQSHFYTMQPRFFLNTYEYNMSANPGDVITVSAFCILFGYNTRSTTVSQIEGSIQV